MAVQLPAFEPGAVLDAIERSRCTYTLGLPALVQLVVEEQPRRPLTTETFKRAKPVRSRCEARRLVSAIGTTPARRRRCCVVAGCIQVTWEAATVTAIYGSRAQEGNHRPWRLQHICAGRGPDPTYGEVVVAFVSLRNGATPSEQKLREYMLGSLADYKVPERILCIPELPKGATGKVHRLSLKALLQKAVRPLEESVA